MRLKITEIFRSIQGEANSAGWPTVFVRLTGCPLRCHYCDTAYAFHGGGWMTVPDIVEKVSTYATQRVTVTGGEPLAQKSCHELLSQLCGKGFSVSLETSGAIDISTIDKRVEVVMDLKTPASGEMDKNKLENITHLKPNDQLKFIVCDREDYEWVKGLINEHPLSESCTVLISASHGTQSLTELAEWVLEDNLPVRLQVQLHKYIWGDAPGR